MKYVQSFLEGVLFAALLMGLVFGLSMVNVREVEMHPAPITTFEDEVVP